MKMMMKNMRRLARATVCWDSCLEMLIILVILMLITLMRMQRSIFLHLLTSWVLPDRYRFVRKIATNTT
ncbi:hypothetical protein K1719_042786 [Acacia pycnantha]|nr:hypothetical protein K1719_042786 [Acacia pycnantha]